MFPVLFCSWCLRWFCLRLLPVFVFYPLVCLCATSVSYLPFPSLPPCVFTHQTVFTPLTCVSPPSRHLLLIPLSVCVFKSCFQFCLCHLYDEYDVWCWDSWVIQVHVILSCAPMGFATTLVCTVIIIKIFCMLSAVCQRSSIEPFHGLVLIILCLQLLQLLWISRNILWTKKLSISIGVSRYSNNWIFIIGRTVPVKDEFTHKLRCTLIKCTEKSVHL